MARRAQRAGQLQPVHVRQVQVEEQQVDGGAVERPAGLRPGARLADGDEAGHPPDVHHMRVGGHRVVLDDQDSDGLPGHRAPPAPFATAPAVSRSGIRTSNTAPPSSPEVTARVPPCRDTACRTRARPRPRPPGPDGLVV